MILKFLIDGDYDYKFQELSASKQLKSFQICNDIAKESISYVIAADITTEIVDGVGEDICSICQMCYINGEMTVIKTETF